MFYDDDLGTENIFFPVCLISEYASVTINVYIYSIHLGIWDVTAVFQFPFNLMYSVFVLDNLSWNMEHIRAHHGICNKPTWKRPKRTDQHGINTYGTNRHVTDQQETAEWRVSHGFMSDGQPWTGNCITSHHPLPHYILGSGLKSRGPVSERTSGHWHATHWIG